ncbi:MAG: RNA polymerase sigma-70 factor [Cyclobacteriaceae bacterium]
MKEPEHTPQIFNIREDAVFEALFKNHYAELVNFGNKYLNDPEQSKELVQEVFLNIWQQSEKLKIQTSVKSYLFGAVRNAALNHIKHQKVEQKYQDRVRFNATESETVDFLELDELKHSIENALDKIPEKCREIFELNRFEGKRYKEIADQLGISLKTVENQMGKALKILRNELGDYLPIVLLLISLHGGKI